jgi:putative membrane protein insertion efficiency factor
MFGVGLGASILRAPRSVAVGVVAIYRAAISPLIHALNGPACRFEPSCSVYARDAIAEYGIVRGGAMALWRIARCNPLGGYGYDPVLPSSPSLSGRGNSGAFDSADSARDDKKTRSRGATRTRQLGADS